MMKFMPQVVAKFGKSECDQGRARSCSTDDVQVIVQVLRHNRSWFMTEDNSFSPDHFDSLRVLLLDRYPSGCVQQASEIFFSSASETEPPAKLFMAD